MTTPTRSFAKLVKPAFLIKHWKIKVGDEVYIRSGDDKGKSGIVIETDELRNVLKVRGAKMQKIFDNGQEKEVEKYIHYSRVNLMDPIHKVPTRTKIQFVDGQMIRIAKKSGAVIPIPDEATPAPKDFSEEPIGPKDTEPEAALENTYFYHKDVADMKHVRQQMTKYNHDFH